MAFTTFVNGNTAPASEQNENFALIGRAAAFKSKVGQYYGPNIQGRSTTGGTLNRLYFLPFVTGEAFIADRIAVYCSTFSAPGTVIRLGIYNNSAGLPSTLKVDAGTVTFAASTTLYPLTISQTLEPGVYWLAAAVQTAVGSTYASGINSASGGGDMGMPMNADFTIGTWPELYHLTGQSGTLPTTVTSSDIGIGSGTRGPVIGLRRA